MPGRIRYQPALHRAVEAAPFSTGPSIAATAAPTALASNATPRSGFGGACTAIQADCSSTLGIAAAAAVQVPVRAATAEQFARDDPRVLRGGGVDPVRGVKPRSQVATPKAIGNGPTSSANANG
jgi:hypothetical protein